MNQFLLEVLMRWPKAYITKIDLQVILGKTLDSRKGIIKRAMKEGYLKRLKANLYLIDKIPNKPLADSFEVAGIIYGPSYISFESALSFHGWIPEAVYTTSCASTNRSKTVSNILGVFSFEKIPEQAFPLGIFHRTSSASSYLLADPWKALGDLVYTRKKAWSTLEDLYEDMRVEMETVQTSSLEILQLLAKEYPNKRTQSVLAKLYKGAQELCD